MSSFYSIAFIVNLMMRHETWAWCGVTLRGRNMCLKRKEVFLILYYLDKNWYYFIKEKFRGWDLSKLDEVKFHPSKPGSCNHHLRDLKLPVLPNTLESEVIKSFYKFSGNDLPKSACRQCNLIHEVHTCDTSNEMSPFGFPLVKQYGGC